MTISGYEGGEAKGVNAGVASVGRLSSVSQQEWEGVVEAGGLIRGESVPPLAW